MRRSFRATRLAGLAIVCVVACGDYHTCLLSSMVSCLHLASVSMARSWNEEDAHGKRVEALVGEHAVSTPAAGGILSA